MAKTVTITMTLNDDVVENEVKTWVKSCPFSPQGGQTVTWKNEPDPEPPATKGTSNGKKTRKKG